MANADAIRRRVDWLRCRAGACERHGDKVLAQELTETADQMDRLVGGIYAACLDPQGWKEQLEKSLRAIERRATR